MIIENEYNIALKAVNKASTYILAQFNQRDFACIEKLPNDFVTDADLTAQQIIREILSSESSYPIIGEENLFDHQNQNIVWAIDPIDGTVNFINNIPIFACAVSLINLKDFTSYVGVINLPFYQKTISAYNGGGAFLNGNKIELKPNNHVSIAVMRNRRGSKLTNSELKNITHFRNFGSASYEFTMLAEQKINLYYDDSTCLWDFAAGKAIIKEIGGKVDVFPYDRDNLILSKYKVKASLYH